MDLDRAKRQLCFFFFLQWISHFDDSSLLSGCKSFPRNNYPSHYFEKTLLLYPGLSSTQDAVIGLKKYKQAGLFPPNSIQLFSSTTCTLSHRPQFSPSFLCLTLCFNELLWTHYYYNVKPIRHGRQTNTHTLYKWEWQLAEMSFLIPLCEQCVFLFVYM